MAQEQMPALSDERKAYRDRFVVRLITEKEEGLHISHQAEGVFGYTTSPNATELPLFVHPVYRCFEVHKLKGGEVCFVGYLREKEYEAFQVGSEPTVVNLYPEPHNDALKLVSVPSSRIDRMKPPTRDDGNSIRLEVAPKVDYSGLGASRN